MEERYLCFEEDCDAQVALRELMDKKMIQAPVNEYFGPGAYEAVINSSVQISPPRILAGTGKGPYRKSQPRPSEKERT